MNQLNSVAVSKKISVNLLFSFLPVIFAISCHQTKEEKKIADTGVDVTADVMRTGSIEIPESSFDFGKVNRGDEAKHSFTIKNKTNRKLKLIRALGT